jgi:hypothetical protein
MKSQLALQGECLTANGAAIRPFSRVQANMAYEGRPPEEAFPTMRAEMALHLVVQFAVDVQRRRTCECFGTNVTSIWAFTRVASYVDSELLVGVESFATELATIRPLSSVSSHVQLQVKLLAELPTTILAHEALIFHSLFAPLPTLQQTLPFLVPFWQFSSIMLASMYQH